MKKVFKMVPIALWILFLILHLQDSSAQKNHQNKLTQNDFETQLLNALEINDESKIRTLIFDNRYLLHSVVDKLLNMFLKMILR